MLDALIDVRRLTLRVQERCWRPAYSCQMVSHGVAEVENHGLGVAAVSAVEMALLEAETGEQELER